MKEILVVVDMQKDFLTGALGSERAAAIIPVVKNRVEEARARGVQVAFTRDTHGKDYMQTQEGRKLPVPHCEKDTDGWQIADGLYEIGELVFDKPVFGSIALAEFLKTKGFDKITFVGVCTDICVVSNVLLAKAYCPEAEIFVDSAACAGVTEEKHEAALETMRSCQATVL
jgi:nicotinamidase-related amidase